MELIEIAGVIALSVAVSLAGARAILTASLFLMMRGVATVSVEIQESAPPATQNGLIQSCPPSRSARARSA